MQQVYNCNSVRGNGGIPRKRTQCSLFNAPAKLMRNFRIESKDLKHLIFRHKIGNFALKSAVLFILN